MPLFCIPMSLLCIPMSLFCIQCLFFVFNVTFLYAMSLSCMQCLLSVFSVFADLSCDLMVLISNRCRCRYDRSLFCIECLFSVFNVSFLYWMSLFCMQCLFSVLSVFAGSSCQVMVLISNLCRCKYDWSLLCIWMSLSCIQCRFSVCNVTCLYEIKLLSVRNVFGKSVRQTCFVTLLKLYSLQRH